MIISHNIAALNTYQQLTVVNNATGKSLEKLSSGYRINRAVDDAAGLAISEKMRSQIRGLDQAERNAQDGISLIQTAEGALSETHSILQRMRELAVQAANDTNTAADRAEIQKEIDQLTSELDRISTDTEFNTKNLLDGTLSNTATVGGTNTAGITAAEISNDGLVAGTYDVDVSASSVAVAIDDAGTTTVDSAAITGTDVDMGDYTLTLTANGTNFDAVLADGDGNTVASVFNETLDNGGQVDTLAIGGITFTWNDTGGATSVAAGTVDLNVSADLTVAVRDTSDSALGAKTVTGNKTGQVSVGGFTFSFDSDLVDSAGGAAYDTSITVATNAITFQIGANEDQTTSVSINDMSSSALGVDSLDVTTEAGATAAITSVDSAVTTLSSERSKLGAIQNRLEHTINNLAKASENLTAAESRIRDVDMAKEIMDFTKNNIISQAATAMLAQANQMPQQVLQLLR